MTHDARAELRRLLGEATPGPWTVRADHDPEEDHEHIDDPAGSPVALVEIGEFDGDAKLIVAAVNALPGLLDRLDQLEAAAQGAINTLYALRHDPFVISARTRLEQALNAARTESDDG